MRGYPSITGLYNVFCTEQQLSCHTEWLDGRADTRSPSISTVPRHVAELATAHSPRNSRRLLRSQTDTSC